MPGADVIKSNIKNTLKKLLHEKGLKVSKIIIFGSFVKGSYRDDSDIDVVIVSDNFRNKSIFERVELTTGVGSKLVKHLKMPFDLIYYSDEEWENENFLIINEAKKHGEVLYDLSSHSLIK